VKEEIRVVTSQKRQEQTLDKKVQVSKMGGKNSVFTFEERIN
jgi:hypothetical protein